MSGQKSYEELNNMGTRELLNYLQHDGVDESEADLVDRILEERNKKYETKQAYCENKEEIMLAVIGGCGDLDKDMLYQVPLQECIEKAEFSKIGNTVNYFAKKAIAKLEKLPSTQSVRDLIQEFESEILENEYYIKQESCYVVAAYQLHEGGFKCHNTYYYPSEVQESEYSIIDDCFEKRDELSEEYKALCEKKGYSQLIKKYRDFCYMYINSQKDTDNRDAIDSKTETIPLSLWCFVKDVEDIGGDLEEEFDEYLRNCLEVREFANAWLAEHQAENDSDDVHEL